MPWRNTEVVEVQPQSFLTSALEGGEWSTSHATCFTNGQKACSTRLNRGWVSTRPNLTFWGREKYRTPARGPIPCCSDHSFVTVFTTLSKFLSHMCGSENLIPSHWISHFFGTGRFTGVIKIANSILTQMKPVHNLTHSFIRVHSNTVLWYEGMSFNLFFPCQFSSQ